MARWHGRAAGATAWALGAMLLWSAVYKVWQPTQGERLVAAVVPALSNMLVVDAIASIEWIVGTALLVGKSHRRMLGIFIVMISMFSVLLFRAKAIGFEGSCGCLGLKGSASAALARNGVLTVLALISFFAPSLEANSVPKE